MSDTPFYAPSHWPQPRSLQLIERLWAIRKDGKRYDGELRDHGQWGVEFQVLCDLEWFDGHRHDSRELALIEADKRKTQYLREGGILIG